MSTLEHQLRTAFTTFAEWIARERPFARENELVSLFAFGPLIDAVEAGSPLSDRRQVGIEVAVPQVLKREGGKTMVRKDLVIWRRPGQTAWDTSGAVADSPLAIIEWKGGRGASRRSIRQLEHDHDLCFLRTATSTGDVEGYAVLAAYLSHGWTVRVARVTRGAVDADWFKSGATDRT